MEKEFKYSKKGDTWFPVINIILRGPKKRRSFKALVDSGASFSVFRSDVADYLGIPLEKGKPIYLTGIGGRILGYLHNLRVSVNDKNFNCKIVFSKEYTVSLNILGRDNFFQPFLISFWEKAKKVILKEV
ncbi:retropepsin-like domain-containing protein [Patescibacteria group bacterium]|nr:retropepsin-like domain-containing protein [Patescibacteria group bacterium]